jgi:NADH-quinone oxidoreductase subunit M
MPHILSIMIFLPLLGMVLVMLMNKERHVAAIRWTATLVAAITFVLSALAWYAMSSGPGMQMEVKLPWIPALGVTYHLGVDGLAMPMIFLTTLLTLLSVIYSWRIQVRVKEYMAFFLLLETGMLGVFCALDFFLFYVFWEISLVPMYFLIGIWGGPRREYAAIKFFLYTLVGSLAMLLSILVLYFFSQPHSFDMLELARQNPMARMPLWGGLVFWGLFLGFAVKVPMFPFHTWLPDAHVEAPTAGSVILAGVLLKMGAYGFLRVILPIVPQEAQKYAMFVAVLAVISIIYGALCAMAQRDLKKLIAYSSVNHMGYVMLGIAAAVAVVSGGDLTTNRITALNGAVLQMFNHGIITGALFFLVGVIYDRAHTRDLDAFGGLAKRMPVYAGIMMLACFGSLGLPGLAGFVSEFMVFMGAFGTYPLMTGLSLLGVVITAAFFLVVIQRMFLGEVNLQWQSLHDMDFGELAATVPLCLIMLVVGLFPGPLVGVINVAMASLLQSITGILDLASAGHLPLG